MPCARGCCDSPAEHYRSLRVASSDRRQLTKVTTDVHDHHKVDVTEHWHERQDVNVRLEQPVRLHGDPQTGRLEQG